MTSKLDWDLVTAQLPAGWRELAVERGLIRPQPPQLHAKVTDIEQVLRPLLHRIGLETSLQTATSTAALAMGAIAEEGGPQATQEAKLVDLSAPALHYWERKLASYLSELLAKMLDPGELFSPLRWAGYEVVSADGTVVTRPGADGTTARVLYALRLSDLRVLGCHVFDQHGGESLRVFDVHRDQLWIADRFYADPYDVAWVVDAGAAVLIRYKFNALPLYDARGRRRDVMALARTARSPGRMAEWPLEVRPPNHAPIRGRLCVLRLTAEETDAARDRLRREEGGVSARAIEAAAWLIVFTTADPKRMTTRQVLDLYRLRWQVELEIRREKSLGGLDKLPNFRDDTIATWLLGKLLIHQIARKIVSPSVAFPPSAADFDLLAHSDRDPQEARPPHQTGRQRAVASARRRVPGHPRRPAPRQAG